VTAAFGRKLETDRKEQQSSARGGTTHTLGMRVIGEGVVVPALVELLIYFGFDKIQGCLLAKPSLEVAVAEAAAIYKGTHNMNRKPAPCAPQSEADTQTQSLFERIVQLERENLQLQEALDHNRRLFGALIRNGCHGITLTGPHRRIVQVFKGLTGFDVGALPGKLIDSLAIPEDRQAIVDAYRNLMQRKSRQIVLTVRFPQANGVIMRVIATVTDMLDDVDVMGIVWNYSLDTSFDPNLAGIEPLGQVPA
jgi:hypothetical protein